MDEETSHDDESCSIHDTTEGYSYYIYCGKCGGLDISWLNQAEVARENKDIQIANKAKERKADAGQESRETVLIIAILLALVFPPVGVPLFIVCVLVEFSAHTDAKHQKIRAYKYRCEKCGFEFCHTFPRPREDNPFGYPHGWDSISSHIMPTYVYVEVTDEIKGYDLRKGAQFPPVTASEIQRARRTFFSEVRSRKVAIERARVALGRKK
ncbi:MAG: hypothetical protein ABIG86_01390 [Patescibacteria group bacterium]